MDASQPAPLDRERRHTPRAGPPSGQRLRGRVALYRNEDGWRRLSAFVRLPGARREVEVSAMYRPGADTPLADTVLVILPQPEAMGQRLDALRTAMEMCEVEAVIARMRGGGVWVEEWGEAALRVRYVAGQWRGEMRKAAG